MGGPARTSEGLIGEVERERGGALLDTRRIVGGLFLFYGLVLAALGLGGSDMKLSAGVVVLIAACLVGARALLRPLGSARQGAEAGADPEPSEERRFTRDERPVRAAGRIPPRR